MTSFPNASDSSQRNESDKEEVLQMLEKLAQDSDEVEDDNEIPVLTTPKQNQKIPNQRK